MKQQDSTAQRQRLQRLQKDRGWRYLKIAARRGSSDSRLNRDGEDGEVARSQLEEGASTGGTTQLRTLGTTANALSTLVLGPEHAEHPATRITRSVAPGANVLPTRQASRQLDKANQSPPAQCTFRHSAALSSTQEASQRSA